MRSPQLPAASQDREHVGDHLARLLLETGELALGLGGTIGSCPATYTMPAVHHRLGVVAAGRRRGGRGDRFHRRSSREKQKKRAGHATGPLFSSPARKPASPVYLRCLETSLVISNIDTCFLPPKTSLSLSSALIMRRLVLSWRLFFLM